MPVFSFAQEVKKDLGLIPCNQGAECDFKAFLTLINNVIRFILVYLAVPICAIMFAYSGFLLVTAGEETASARTKAKDIFTNAAIGLLLVAGAYLIIKTLLSILGYNASWIGL